MCYYEIMDYYNKIYIPKTLLSQYKSIYSSYVMNINVGINDSILEILY